MVSFLKGFNLTLTSWREGGDENDWKISAKRWRMILCSRSASEGFTDSELESALEHHKDVGAPKLVRASPSMWHDLEALSSMMQTTTVPEVSIRSKMILTVVCGFGDASRSGLGATFTDRSGFNFRIGVWGSEEDPESSNRKEFSNVVKSLEDEAAAGNMDGAEVYMFTDNVTVESCAARAGSSSSPKLLHLVVRLHSLTTNSGVKIHTFHVAGTRMIAQGTDGVSRGYLGQGVMAGESMVAHIPVHLTAVERSPTLVPWIRSWCGDAIFMRMDKDGFERLELSEGQRIFVWTPHPIGVEVAIAELRKAHIKRQHAYHVFVCPRLCTAQWAKQLYRAADFVFELPVGFSFWSTCMHEPLLIGILFPFLSVRPWQIKGTPKMFTVGRELQKMLKESEVGTRNILCQLWTLACDLPSMPEHLVSHLLFLR